jgi:hypothetical protein
MSLTVQQKQELLRLADVCSGDASPGAYEALFDFVDRLADARTINFAQAALQAAGGIDETGCAYRPQAVVLHLANTLEQYAQLGLKGVQSC